MYIEISLRDLNQKL